MSESGGASAHDQNGRADSRNPVEDAVETLVYGTIGALVTTLEDWPRIVERGRREAASRIAPARVIGQLAVGHGHREAERMTRDFLDRVAQLSVAFLQGFSSDSEQDLATETPDTPEAPSATQPTSVPALVDLAIDSYATLSASQVAARLGGLSASQLEAVKQYEIAHRSRASVLNAIESVSNERDPK